MLALEARGLAKSYRGLFGGPSRPGLAALDLAIPVGEWVALVGPNGSGKSTLLRLCATVLRPTTGHAWVHGHALDRHLPDVRRQIAYVGGEGQGLDPRLTGRQNAFFRSALYGLDDRSIAER